MALGLSVTRTDTGEAPYRSWPIRPPRRSLGTLRGLATMARNPVEWWPQRLYDEGIVSVRLAGRTYVHIARPALARTVLLERADAFCRSFVLQGALEPAMGRGLLTSDGAPWKRQRRLVAPVFGRAATDTCLPLFDASARRCTAALQRLDGSATPLLPHLSRATLDIIIGAMFGDWAADRDALARDVETYLLSLGSPDPLALLGVPAAVPRPWRRRGLVVVTRLRRLCHDALAEKRADGVPDDSLARRLLDERDPDTGEALGDEAIVDNLMTFIGAGHETGSVALCWTLHLLAAQPRLQARVRAEARAVLGERGERPLDRDALERLTLHGRVLDESLRLYPPVAALVRGVAQEVRLGELSLVPGDHVTVAVLPMHRSEALWPDPHAFDAERFRPEAVRARDRFGYLPFGSGPRVCVAGGFAKAEATVLLARLVLGCRFALPDGAPPPHPVLRVTLRPSAGMVLAVKAA